jgi:hypothetical protein
MRALRHDRRSLLDGVVIEERLVTSIVVEATNCDPLREHRAAAEVTR